MRRPASIQPRSWPISTGRFVYVSSLDNTVRGYAIAFPNGALTALPNPAISNAQPITLGVTGTIK